MTTIFLHELNRLRGQILGWGIALALLVAYVVVLYDTLATQQAQYLELFKAYPSALMAFFGDVGAMFTPNGYLNFTTFSYMPPILGFFAVLVGSGLLASDEEKGTLDLVLAYPVSRTTLFVGRLLAFGVAAAAILTLMWLAFAVTVGSTKLGVTAGEMALPLLSLFAVLVLFGGLSLLLSMALPSRSSAAMVAGLLLVANYFLISLGRIDKGLTDVAKYTPLYYYQGGDAIQGLDMGWFGGLLVAGLVCIVLAWWLFQRRDIRIGGEGSWWTLPGLPGLRHG